MNTSDKLLHRLLDATAARDPGAVAVHDRQLTFSYALLDTLSNGIAASLLARGVRPGDRVGILMEKSPWAVAAIFGVLKAGACYLPLDPQSPPLRHAFMLHECQTRCLIVSARRAWELPLLLRQNTPVAHVLVPDSDDPVEIDAAPGANIACRGEIISAANSRRDMPVGPGEASPAYCLYTSGSTGKPKGVLVSHAASRAFVDWAAAQFGLGPGDSVSSHAPYHFDLSVFDIFASVAAGAAIEIVPQAATAFPRDLADFIADTGLTVWYSVPSALIQLVRFGNLGERTFPRLRLVLFAGEPFPPKYLRELMQTVPAARYCNLYGPTETNVCTFHWVDEPPAGDDPLPIGRPCPGHTARILDGTGRPVEPGKIGELCMSSPTLMSEYWNDPQKTRSAIRDHEGVPLYATGDLVRLNAEGLIEFHGRADALLKSRGYRIEPGEIEAVLLGHPGVAEAAVAGVPDEQIGTRLQGFIVPGPDAAPGGADLEIYCAERLPRYMVPEVFHFRHALPRTPTQKIDRKRLLEEERS